jgi:hypothetical protein
MPVNLVQPRANTVRKHLRSKEQKTVLAAFTEALTMAQIFHLVSRIFRVCNRDTKSRLFMRCTLAMAVIAMMHIVEMDCPFTRMHAADFTQFKAFTDFSEEAFQTHFRFRPHDFHQVLQLMGFISAEGVKQILNKDS